MTADPTFPKKPAIAMEQLRKPSYTVHILGQKALDGFLYSNFM